MNRTALSLCTLALLGANASGSVGTGLWIDLAGDAKLRRTDPGADGPLGSGFTPIDLLSVRLQGWTAPNAASDRYTGSEFTGRADLFRMDIEVAGVVCPPGPLGLGGYPYDPHRFGDRPLFGFIELDIDDRKNSGGEFMPLAANRYLANIGRFGLSPQGSISERMVRSAEDFDSNFSTLPQFERTGGEFTLALCGCFAPTVVSEGGDQDGIFEAGETWIVRGRFFERFQAFEPASALFGGSDFGLWDPMVELRFVHDIGSDVTTITLVEAITNVGAGLLTGQAAQPLDLSLLNQTSIFEALDDLISGADFATGQLSEITDDWQGRKLDDYQRPREWGVNALIGTAYITPQPGALFAWTDTGFYETYGDLNDDDLVTELDSLVITNAIESDDGGWSDDDGVVNGRVAIPNFGPSFDLRDLNGDGVIELFDRWEIACPADLAAPYGVVNVFDVMAFVGLYNQQSQLADLVDNDIFNIFDIMEYINLYNQGCP
ncbi:MAG: hypothetical protein D6692_05225 [Planctomycetota bacterium]|nr:MAG: hypothetical protein D6692_05225 [Planctomycetota bacterium]